MARRGHGLAVFQGNPLQEDFLSLITPWRIWAKMKGRLLWLSPLARTRLLD